MTLTPAEKLELELGRRPTLAERGIEPAEKTGQGADFDNARSQFPSVKAGEDEWVELFHQRPEVMLAILGDIYRETKAQEIRESQGKVPTGRRPRSINGNMAELEAMVTPRYSMEPFGEAVRELIGERTLRAFALKVPMSHTTLMRMMRGEMRLERHRLEAIAAAGKVGPSFFMEWRLAYIQEAVEAVFVAKPNLSIRATRQLQEARRRGGR